MTAAHDELRALVAEVRGLLEYEEELGGPGLPATPLPRSAIAPVVVAEPERPAPPPVTPPGEAAKVAAASMDVDADASTPDPAPIGERLPEPEARARLAIVATQAAACTTCRLHASRTKSVFARGSITSEVVFVGEGPGYNEDQTGLPFVGAAGQLLDKMIVAMGYAPDDVYICNVVKCRPPENRTPQPDEANACAPFLVEQLAVVRPKVIVALGRCAAENLGVMPEGGRGWRGAWGTYQGIPVMPTYHPAFLLRSPEFKRQVWDDLKKVLASIGRSPRGQG